MQTDEMRERLTRLEEQLKAIAVDVRENRDSQQKVMGLTTTLRQIQERQIEDSQSLKAAWTALEPLAHSNPDITSRLRIIEDQQLVQRTQVKVMAVIATFVAPLITALLVSWMTGAFV